MIIASLSLALLSVPAPCNPPEGWDEVAAEADGKFLVFGELHGSTGSPELVAEYVCAASEDRAILVAVEFSARGDDQFQSVWALRHDQFADALLRDVGEWRGRKDGVASEAMRDMLVRLHALKSMGRKIDIVAFNGARDDAQRAQFSHLPGQEPHEAAQAANIRAAAEAGNYHQTIVLVGNLHAMESPVTHREPQWRPMAMHLAAPEDVVTLKMLYEAGETWSCQLRPDVDFEPGKPLPEDAIICGPYPAESRTTMPGPQMKVADNPGPYDGHYYIGKAVASPPALPE